MGAAGYDSEKVVGPQIENGARIGVGAILLPNVKIGANAQVAAGAIVTKSVEPFDKVMGIPARSTLK